MRLHEHQSDWILKDPAHYRIAGIGLLADPDVIRNQ